MTKTETLFFIVLIFFFLWQLNPHFQETLVKSYIYLFVADKLIQCLQLLQMHPRENHLKNVLTFVKSISGPRSECLALVLEWLSLGSVPSDPHTQRNCSGVGSTSKWTSRESLTQRQSWTAETEKFFGKLIWERGRYVIWLVQQQRVVSLRTKGKQEGNYVSKRIVCRHLRLGTVGLIAGFNLRGIFQPK